MYETLIALDKEQHSNLRYTAQNTYSFARKLTNVPLLAEEIAQVSEIYPVLFATGEQAQPIALLGLRDENVYLNDRDEWNANYIPAFVRRYPFILAKGIENDSQYFLSIDPNAIHFAETTGEPVIAAEGKLTDLGKNALNFLRIYQESVLKTEAALSALQAMDVLVEKTLTIQDGKTTRLIGGFRTVDPNKLDALPDEVLAKWVRNGLINLIHNHWNSLKHLNKVAIASGRPETTN